jgi:hypothetical protein
LLFIKKKIRQRVSSLAHAILFALVCKTMTSA